MLIEVYARWIEGDEWKQEFVGSVSCPHEGLENMTKRGVAWLEPTLKRAADVERFHNERISTGGAK